MPEPDRVVARAPGRVNLIGEHTDYNDGFVLPMALPFETRIDATARTGRTVTLHSHGYGDVSFDLDGDPADVVAWGRYVAAMAHLLALDGVDSPAFEAEITTNIPVGASLSSSAALEVAAGLAITALAGGEPDGRRIAQLGQRVENEFAGIQSGIMDQLISACATEGTATLIDCRDLTLSAVPLPPGTTVLIMDTMTRRELVDSEYDERRRSCERAAAALGVDKLRDADMAMVARLPDSVDRRRAEHVVSENKRVLGAVDAMGSGDAGRLGQLMNESHESLSTLYEVSSSALDSIVGAAREHGGTLGARMTGGGFAGCAVALVRSSEAGDVTGHVRRTYTELEGVEPDVWAVEPAAGASILTD